MYLPYKKRYFRRHQWNTICFRAQITQILLFSRMPVLERSKITVWKQHLSEIFFAMEVLPMCLPYVKRYFQEHQWNGFFFRAQMSQILLFSGIAVSERWKITVWEQHLSKKKFWYECFRYLSTLRKKDFQEHQWSAFFFRSQITHILMFSGMPVSERSKITVWEQQLSKNIFYYVRFMYVSTLQKKIFLAAPMEYFFL